jgi:hypothetical protein
MTISQTRPRSLLVGLVLITTVTMLVLAARWKPGEETPVSREGYSAPVVPALAAVPKTDPAARRLLRADRLRVDRALRAVEARSKPFLDRSVAGPPTVVVPAGRHDLTDLIRKLPNAFAVRGRTVVLQLPLIVTPRARLTITDRRLLLSSTPRVRANVVAVGGRLVLRDVSVRSRGADGGPDLDLHDGRAYLQVQAGHMALRSVRATHLGFATGSTSGVAWMQRLGIPSTGGATDSTFAHNLYGVYSSGASGLRFLRDRFVHNHVYGFDPHGAPPGAGTNEALGTNDTLVSDSIAAYNGRHGFIFSSGCHRNVVRNSISRFNGGNGFVIDDGRIRGTVVNPSNDNTLRNVVATRNGGTGVVIEGGRDNAVVASRIDTNRAGVRISDRARNAVVRDTTVVNTLWTAISVSEGSTAHIDSVSVTAAAVGVRSTGMSNITGVVVQNAAVAGFQLQPTDRVVRASVTGTGARTVDGIHFVDASGWTTTMPGSSGHLRLLSTTRHQVWILLFLVPMVLWSGARLVHFVRNLTTRTGL